jgi:hypothetical protein
VLFWSLGVSGFIAILLGFFFQHYLIGLSVFVILVVASFMAAKIEYVKNRLIVTRYIDQPNQIKRNRQAIENLQNNAKSYQERLEFRDGSGFLATFMDVLLSEY